MIIFDDQLYMIDYVGLMVNGNLEMVVYVLLIFDICLEEG